MANSRPTTTASRKEEPYTTTIILPPHHPQSKPLPGSVFTCPSQPPCLFDFPTIFKNLKKIHQQEETRFLESLPPTTWTYEQYLSAKIWQRTLPIRTRGNEESRPAYANNNPTIQWLEDNRPKTSHGAKKKGADPDQGKKKTNLPSLPPSPEPPTRVPEDPCAVCERLYGAVISRVQCAYYEDNPRCCVPCLEAGMTDEQCQGVESASPTPSPPQREGREEEGEREGGRSSHFGRVESEAAGTVRRRGG